MKEQELNKQLHYTRAELRRMEREERKLKASYTLTKEQIDNLKKEATEEAANVAFSLLLTIPCEVLMDHYWPKTYQKKIPEFVDYILEYYRQWQDGEVTIEELQKDLYKWTGITLVPGKE